MYLARRSAPVRSMRYEARCKWPASMAACRGVAPFTSRASITRPSACSCCRQSKCPATIHHKQKHSTHTHTHTHCVRFARRQPRLLTTNKSFTPFFEHSQNKNIYSLSFLLNNPPTLNGECGEMYRIQQERGEGKQKGWTSSKEKKERKTEKKVTNAVFPQSRRAKRKSCSEHCTNRFSLLKKTKQVQE